MSEQREVNEFEKFDQVRYGLLAVPYQELQKELEKDRKEKSPQEAR